MTQPPQTPLLLESTDSKFVVVQSGLEMVDALAHIQRESFPDLSPTELMRAEHYASQISVFPEGQHALLERSSGKVVAASTDLRARVDFSHYQHRYMDAVDNNYIRNHDPSGDWLYGADIGVLPEFRGFKLSSLLYQARHALIRRLKLRGHVAGAMPKGYGAYSSTAHPGERGIEQYVFKVARGEISDPVLSVVFKRGYAPYGIIPDYLEDASCGNFGVFVVWRNPEMTR